MNISRGPRDAAGDQASADVQASYLQRVDKLFSLTGEGNTIGKALTSFFEGIDNLALNPSSIELRRDFLERATDLVQAIKTSFNSLADLQKEADDRVRSEVDAVNSLTTQIASLNGDIIRVEASGQTAADQRDQRDLLLNKLSEHIGFSTVEQSDGSVTISLSNGFALVNGMQSRSLEATTSPSFATGSLPDSLYGGVLSYVVFDYGGSATDAHLDLTDVLKNSSGAMAGLLAVRGTNAASNDSAFDADGTLVDTAKRIEALTRSLLVNVNTQYLGPDRDSGTAGHQPTAGDLDGNTPAVFGLFNLDYTGYAGAPDADGDGLPETSDLTATGFDNFSSRLQLSISDPRDVAAARDSSGTTTGALVFAPGDGRNMEALSSMQNSNISFATNANYTLTSTFGGLYNETVSFVGAARARGDINQSVAQDVYITASNQRDEVQAVNLDEEFTSLIKFQKAFEASAKLVRTADQMLEALVSLI